MSLYNVKSPKQIKHRLKLVFCNETSNCALYLSIYGNALYTQQGKQHN